MTKIVFCTGFGAGSTASVTAPSLYSLPLTPTPNPQKKKSDPYKEMLVE